jgi:ketosteroid isomerase-like protein
LWALRSTEGSNPSPSATWTEDFDWSIELDRLFDAGDGGVVVATFEARAYGKHSDVAVKVTGAHLWTLRGGKIVARHVYLDASEALEAVGLSE